MVPPLLLLLLPLAQDPSVLLPPEPSSPAASEDWLVAPASWPARLCASPDGRGVVLTNGLVRREVRVVDGAATVALDSLVRGGGPGSAVLRSVRPEARLVLDGVEHAVGGLLGQRNHAFLTPEVQASLEPDPSALQLVGWEQVPVAEPFGWARPRHHAAGAAWPPAGVGLRLDFAFDAEALQRAGLEQAASDLARVRVSIHHELYDGLPCVAKWLTVTNGSDQSLTLDRFTSEVLAVVEGESRVETRDGVNFRTPNLWVETDYATGGANENGQRWSVHWKLDPLYESQVNYLRQTPCLLECGPGVGPSQDLEPGETFQSFRSFVLVHDSEDRARNGLARCRMYRTLAPWVTENPLMMHVRYADEESVRRAIDQCAEVGFEMVILTFGSGFNMEDDSPEHLAKMRGYADYARSKGVEIGGYSLLSSRSIGGGNDVVSPPGQQPAHGSCPALASPWGQEYYRKLHAFFPATGFTLLEHDGPYPGDFDITPRPPLQKGYEDSQWVQFWIAADFYRWCREQGIYTNTPDWYHLNGSTKSAMGYREVNWSLPRADQVLHTRQNIFDGTWTKTPTMGWMFVPLTQYHGGGAAATVEPLHEHLDHYGRMLSSNLGAGVQACYRGPRLYDTEQTRALVASEVAWFKEHRAILESDIDHGASRRADGRDLDWMLHVGPTLDTPGMLVVWNPLEQPVRRTLEVDLTYTGLRGSCMAARDGGDAQALEIAGDGAVRVTVEVPAGGRTAVTFTRP
ncbi:MAG: alpha-galactosidase [Planctomycetes bacterium]|nr:alpha-galactosidase [Planctomycetota bacterium]